MSTLRANYVLLTLCFVNCATDPGLDIPDPPPSGKADGAITSSPPAGALNALVLEAGVPHGSVLADFDLSLNSAHGCKITDANGHSPGQFGFPATGTQVTWTNTADQPVLLRAFVVTTRMNVPGADYHWFLPVIRGGLHAAGNDVVPGFPGQVVELAPGDAVTATFPAIEHVNDLDTLARFGCVTVADFAVRPKFSYAARLEFDSLL